MVHRPYPEVLLLRAHRALFDCQSEDDLEEFESLEDNQVHDAGELTELTFHFGAIIPSNSSRLTPMTGDNVGQYRRRTCLPQARTTDVPIRIVFDDEKVGVNSQNYLAFILDLRFSAMQIFCFRFGFLVLSSSLR